MTGGEAQRMRDLERRVDLLRVLADLGAMLNSKLDPDYVREQAIDAIRTLVDCEASSLILRQKDERLSFAVATGSAGSEVTSITLNRGEGIAGWVVEHGQTVVVNDTAADERHSRRVDDEVGFVSRSLICVPLVVKGKVLGALQAVNGVEPFEDSQVTLLELLAQHVATAMENANLHARLQRSLVKLETQQEALIHTEKLSAMGLLAAGVAHEIRSPLTAISGYAQLLRRRDADEAFRDPLLVIERSVDSINRIVNGLLDFAKKGETSWDAVLVDDVVDQAIALCEHTLTRFRKVRIERVSTPDLPLVEADRHQLQQVFVNLIINAAEAMATGGTLIISSSLDERLDVPPEEAIPQIRVSFADTGPGIPPVIRPRIFEPFFSEGKKSGTGLGLSICKSIMKKHRGEIAFFCPDEGGTVFTVDLPVLSDSGVRR